MRRLDKNDLLPGIIESYRAKETVAIITALHPESRCEKLILREGGERLGPSEEGEWVDAAIKLAQEVMASGKSTTLATVSRKDGSEVRVAVEVITPRRSIVIFGAGHVGHALAEMATLAGYTVTVVDDREDFVSRKRFPDPRVEVLARPFETAARSVGINPNTAVVIVTRGHQYDELCLKEVVHSPARYIGMIGSKRRVVAVYQRLINGGTPRELLDKVHAPIGLGIGAISPQEIAVAILGEIIQTFNASMVR